MLKLKEIFKDIDWKNPKWEHYKQAFVKPRPINLFPLYAKRKSENGVEFATFGSRMFAMTLDMFFILALFGALTMNLSAWLFPELHKVEMKQQVLEMIYAVKDENLSIPRLLYELKQMGVFERMLFDHLLQILVSGIYAVTCWHFWQRTPAMWLMRMYVADAKTHQKVSLWRLIWRYVMLIPSMLILSLGYFWIIFTKRSQGWHDLAAGTVVIQKPFPGWKK